MIPPPQDEDIQNTKRPRLEKPFLTSTVGEVTIKNTSHDSTVAALHAAVAMLALCQMLHSSIDPTSARTGRWKTDEDTKLEDAVSINGGKNWNATAALAPGRTRLQF